MSSKKEDYPTAKVVSSSSDAANVNRLSQSINSMKLSTKEKAELLVAASTMQKLMCDDLDEDSLVPNTFSSCDAETFSMRIGPHYHKHKLKGPSATSLYSLAGVDFVKCTKRIDNYASRVKIPDEWKMIDTHHDNIPPVFVVNAQLPSDFNNNLFTETTDGDGWSLVMYFKVTQETADAFANLNTAPAPIKLFAEYCINAPEAYSKPAAPATVFGSAAVNPWVGRFKITTRCENIEKFGLPSFITAYNSKPVLIRHTGVLIRGADYIEMDINIHRFASIPKKALSVLFHRFDQMIISMGFCIESRDEHEMPEVLFGALTLNKPTYVMAAPWLSGDDSVVGSGGNRPPPSNGGGASSSSSGKAK